MHLKVEMELSVEACEHLRCFVEHIYSHPITEIKQQKTHKVLSSMVGSGVSCGWQATTAGS